MPIPFPLLDPLSETVFIQSGDVVIDHSAKIAPGVLLQADPGSRIEIGSGVCIGMGSIIHAHDGTLTFEPGATLGVGVLVVGQGTIGQLACVGSYSTVFDCSIDTGHIVPPGSLVGEAGRDLELDSEHSTSDPVTETDPLLQSANTAQVDDPTAISQNGQSHPKRLIPGRSHLNRILVKIYPHRQFSDT